MQKGASDTEVDVEKAKIHVPFWFGDERSGREGGIGVVDGG